MCLIFGELKQTEMVQSESGEQQQQWRQQSLKTDYFFCFSFFIIINIYDFLCFVLLFFFSFSFFVHFSCLYKNASWLCRISICLLQHKLHDENNEFNNKICVAYECDVCLVHVPIAWPTSTAHSTVKHENMWQAKNKNRKTKNEKKMQ